MFLFSCEDGPFYVYLCMVFMCASVPAGNTCSALLLAGPGDMDLCGNLTSVRFYWLWQSLTKSKRRFSLLYSINLTNLENVEIFIAFLIFKFSNANIMVTDSCLLA